MVLDKHEQELRYKDICRLLPTGEYFMIDQANEKLILSSLEETSFMSITEEIQERLELVHRP